MKRSRRKSKLNTTARSVALISGVINLSFFLLIAIFLVLAPDLIDYLFDHLTVVGVLIYGSFGISFLTACFFKITPSHKKLQIMLNYGILFVINLMSLIVYYGLDGMFQGDTWLH